MFLKIKNLPLPYYGPNDEKGSGEPEKTPAQLERENIKVTHTKGDNNSDSEDDDNENNLDENAGGEEKDENEEEKEEGDEEEKNNEEEKELTPEQKQIQALERKIERLQRRAGKTAAERDENKKLVKELKEQLEVKIAAGEQPLTEEEVNRRAKEVAELELTRREFNRAQEKLINEAVAIDKTFMSKVNELAQEVAPLPEFFIGALNDLDNGGAVLNYLTDNHDEYEDLLNRGNPIKVMKGLLKISDKLIEAGKPKPKAISKAPEPPKAPKGNSGSPDVLPPKPTENMAEFVRIRNQQMEARRKARMG